MTELFDKMLFEGPVGIDGDGLPSDSGIYIVSTSASGGIKMLGIYEGDDIKSSFGTNPKQGCWKENEDHGLQVYYRLIADPSERRRVCDKMISDRWYPLPCVDPPRDDF